MSEVEQTDGPPPHRAGAPARRRPSITDVARLAGVSRQTVSNVLNGRREYFSADTHSRVSAAMETLAYRPSRAAQALRSRRSMQIGYHMFGEQLDVMQGFTLSFLQALVKAAAQDGYHILVFTHHGDALAVFRELIARRSVDAFIVSQSAVDDPRMRLLADSGVPFAAFGRLAPGLPQHWVDVDNVAGMLQLVDYLVGAGHRRFAYVGAAGGEYWKTERWQGFRVGLARYGLEVADDWVVHGSDPEIRGRVREMLTGPNRPSAIVAGSDTVGSLVIDVSKSLGLRAGTDIAVAAFDGGALGLLSDPAMTSVRIPVDKIARELITRCRDEIEDGPTGRPGVLVPTEIVRGDSA